MATANSILTQEKLKELLHYDPETGIFYNRKYRGPKSTIGSRAGCINSIGYECITLDGLRCTAHRLAWLYSYGNFPNGLIDHINRNRSDNRICNLRECNKSENSQNKLLPQSNNTHGFLGVTKDSGKWAARITTNGKTTYIGLYDTPELAHQAYIKEKAKVHQFAPSTNTEQVTT